MTKPTPPIPPTDINYLRTEYATSVSAVMYSSVVRSIGGNIDSLLSDLDIKTQTILQKIDETNDYIDSIKHEPSWNTDTILISTSSQFNSEIDYYIPDFNEPVQQTAAMQTTYNQYVDDFRALGTSVPSEILEMYGVEDISTMSSFDSKYIESTNELYVEIIDKLIESYGVSELRMVNYIFQLSHINIDVETIITDSTSLIFSFTDCGGNLEKRNEWETILYGYVDQLPVDSNYNITVEEIIDVLTLDQTNKDKLLLVWGIIEPTLEAIKLRTEPSS